MLYGLMHPLSKIFVYASALMPLLLLCAAEDAGLSLPALTVTTSSFFTLQTTKSSFIYMKQSLKHLNRYSQVQLHFDSNCCLCTTDFHTLHDVTMDSSKLS